MSAGARSGLLEAQHPLVAHLRRRLLGDPGAGGPDLVRAARGQGVEALVASKDAPEVAATRFAALSGAGFSARVRGALAEAGVPAAVLKGAPVAQLAWDDPTLRPQGDVDVLVEPERMEDAERALVAAGLCRPRERANPFSHHDHLEAAQPGGLLVELHRNLALDGPLRCDVSAVLRRRIQVETPHGPIGALAHEDAVVQLALHADGHGVSRLMWLVDIAAYALRQRVDWVEAAGRAREWEIGPSVGLVWEMARELLGAPVPEAAFEALGVPGWRRRAVRGLLGASAGQRGARGWVLGRAFRLAAMPSLGSLGRLAGHKARMRGGGWCLGGGGGGEAGQVERRERRPCRTAALRFTPAQGAGVYAPSARLDWSTRLSARASSTGRP